MKWLEEEVLKLEWAGLRFVVHSSHMAVTENLVSQVSLTPCVPVYPVITQPCWRGWHFLETLAIARVSVCAHTTQTHVF